jgi:hypothetical protein
MKSPVIRLPDPPDAPKYVMVDCEIAPGQTIRTKVPRECLTAYGLVRLNKQPNGNRVPDLKTWQQYVRLTDDLPSRLGLDIDSDTLRVLCYAGFVKASRPTPFVTLVDVQSLLDHIEATSGDNAAAWWTEERRIQYRTAYYQSGLRLRRTEQPATASHPDLFA